MLLGPEMLQSFEKEYDIRIISISRVGIGRNGFQCHLETDFGKLPVKESWIEERGTEDYPYQAETIIDGIKYYYLISKEEC